MSTISVTINIGEDLTGAVTSLLSRFPRGQRVRVAVTEEPSQPDQVPTLADFTERIEAARRTLLTVPWATTEEAMSVLREGERE